MLRKSAAQVGLGIGLGVSVLSGCRLPAPPTPPALATPAAIRLEDVSRSSGLEFHWPSLPEPLTILDAFGCGCAFVDYDRDGWQDLLFVSEPFPRLYRNLRGRRFEDVTLRTGLSRLRGAWKGCAVCDYDGDGRPDLLLTGYRCLALLRNTGAGEWSDQTARAGFSAGNHWSASAGFMDLNADGRLDLVLLNYVQFGPDDPHYCEPKPGIRAGCPPRHYAPQYAEVWKNLGNGRFRNVSEAAGMRETSGTSQVVGFADVDDDGDPDFYLGNDGVPADLMLNQGDFRFRNVGLESGAAYGSEGTALAAMSVDWADYDRDGRLDLFVTAFSNEPYSLLRSTGKAEFQAMGERTGVAALTRKPLGFGSRWLDFDNDGWPDLAIANGHVYNRTAELYSGTTFRQPVMLLHNRRGERFEDLVPQLDASLRKPRLGRGLATGDWDNDGREDIVLVDYGGAPVLLHNVSRTPGHWITLQLRGKGPNGQAYGARVIGRAGGQIWVGQVSPASSYLSSADPRIHFGLGETAKLEQLEVRWPDGRMQTFASVEGDRIQVATEGENALRSLPAAGSQVRQ